MSGRRVIIVAAAVAVCVVGVAGATAGVQAPSGEDTHGARSGTVFYLFKAEFGVGIEVKWSSESGSRNQACASWGHSEGRFEVNAGSTADIPGSIKIFPRTGSQGWAVMAAVGRAHAVETRTRVDTGGSNWTPGCGGPKPPPFKAPPNDCGEKQYSTRLASLRAAFRRGGTLEELTTDAPSASNATRAIAVDAPPCRCCTETARPCRFHPRPSGRRTSDCSCRGGTWTS